jgi:hypothetical protein
MVTSDEGEGFLFFPVSFNGSSVFQFEVSIFCRLVNSVFPVLYLDGIKSAMRTKQLSPDEVLETLTILLLKASRE